MSDPSHSDAIAKNDEGMRLWNVGDFEGALAAFTTAIDLDPDFEAAYRNRAAAYRELNRHADAAADVDTADSIGEWVACYNCGGDNVAGAGFCVDCGSLSPGIRQHGHDGSKKAFACSAISVVALSVISTVGAAAEGFYFVWFGAASLWLATLLFAGLFALEDKRSITSGIIAGLVVGILVLGGTCGVNLATFDLSIGPGF